MKVSLNTIKQYLGFDLPPVEELVARINEQLGQVEEVIDLSKKYKDAIIVKVIDAEPHPNADRLRVCKIDDGGVTNDVPRDERGYVQVVCGAPNAREGIVAVWLPPSATVPATFEDDEPFVLSARELRGVVSQGMLAAGDELAISSDHEGIIEVDPDEWNPNGVAIVPGVSFAKAFGLDDTVLDIENKMFTHRPDCFGQLGVAREIAGILGHAFTSPEWYWNLPEFSEPESSLPLRITNDVPEKAPRFMTVALKDVTIKPSPLWLQCELVRLGAKPINNIVDATNYVMLLTAQPTHAYDYDQLAGHSLTVRMAREGESATLLNGKTYSFTTEDIVIADEASVVGLAGIMGAGASEVSLETKNIVLEVGTFDMYTLRKSSMRHGIFTDALTRFNKGQSPLQNDRVLRVLMQSIVDVSGGSVASGVADLRNPATEQAYLDQSLHEPQSVSAEFINTRLGSELTDDDIAALLSFVEIAVEQEGGSLQIRAPFWRTDIELPEDIVEEVGRLYGFGMLPQQSLLRDNTPAQPNGNRVVASRIRQQLATAGANEVLTYSFVNEQLLTKAGQQAENAFRLGNALSPDLQYYRLSMTPSLLDKVHMNNKAGFTEFALFEIGKTHQKERMNEEGLPDESARLGLVYARNDTMQGAPYFVAKRMLSYLLDSLHITNVHFQALTEYKNDDARINELIAPFAPDRSAAVLVDDRLIGVVGELTMSVRRNFKLPESCAAFELLLETIYALAEPQASYRPLSRFPSVWQDLSVKVGIDHSYDTVYNITLQSAREAAGDVSIALGPVSIYQPDNASMDRTITFRFTVASDNHTLTDKEVAALIDTVAAKLQKELQTQRI